MKTKDIQKTIDEYEDYLYHTRVRAMNIIRVFNTLCKENTEKGLLQELMEELINLNNEAKRYEEKISKLKSIRDGNDD